MSKSEETISLYELLDLSIGTPQRGAVNFSALHALLHAVLRHLDIQEIETRWRDTPPGDGPTHAAVVANAPKQDHHSEEEGEYQIEAGTELQRRTASTSPPLSPEDGQPKLLSRIQSCEDAVSKAMKLIEELHSQKDNLKEEIKELCHQQKMVGAQAETITAVETYCNRVDTLEETVKYLKDTFQKYPDPVELSQCVTWDVMQSALLTEKENPQKILMADTQPATDTPAVLPGPPQQTRPSSSERYPETVEALRSIGKQRKTFDKLEARVVVLEDEKVDQSQLSHLRKLITDKGPQNELNNLMDQLKQQRALIDGLMSDREKLNSLEEMFMSQDRETGSEAASGSAETDSKATHELRQQISYLRKSVQKLEEGVKQLKSKQALNEERADKITLLQDQLDDLRSILENMILSLTSQLTSSFQDDVEQDESDSEGLSQSKERSAFSSSAVNIGRKLSRLFQRSEQLQDTVNNLLQQLNEGRAGPLNDTENEELINDVQKAILQLQAESEKLHESTSCLHEDNRQKQSHIEELYKTMVELEEKKADKQMVESEIKADKSALESKVSRLQFDSVTEKLNSMFHELLNKVTGQEQDWHKVIDKLSTEMECKLDRIELDSMKTQLEGRWKSIHEKLQAQGAPEHEDAAALRKQLVDRFHCLSCDRPIVKYTPAPNPVRLPSTPAFPAHKSIRPFTVYALEQFRQHYRSLQPGCSSYNFVLASTVRRKREHLQRSHAAMCRQIESTQRQLKHRNNAGSCDTASNNLSQIQPRNLHERVSELTDYSHLTVSRSCGGSHTVFSASQRRTGLRHHAQTEVDAVIQSEEVDIVGLDGHIYKGRLNTPARNTEPKLPTVSTKDCICKTKDKAKYSTSHKPAAASPEVGHGSPRHQPHSAKSAQCSHSASSSSGRDWPVLALGITSQSSLTQASAAAESNTEPPPDERVNL